jgi:hypothetical protein
VVFEAADRVSAACVVRAAELRRLAGQRAQAKTVSKAAAAAGAAAPAAKR